MFNHFMQEAILEAKQAAEKGEIPVGCVIVDRTSQTIVASAHNACEARSDPTAHAEILAIQAACRQYNSTRIAALDLYVTLEPCPMCAHAISVARIKNLYFGAYDSKSGGTFIYHHKSCHHHPILYGNICETECKTLLQSFFQARRD